MLFKKSQHGWRLIRSGWKYFQQRKKLLVLPAVGRGIFFLIISALGLLVWAMRTGKIDYNHWSTGKIIAVYVGMFVALWLANIVSLYWSAALTACLRTEEEKNSSFSLRDGLRTAGQCFPVIFNYIIVHFVFGIANLIFRKKIKESPWVNRLLSGLSWVYATFLFPTVLVNEPAGLQATLQRSSSLMKDFAGKNPRINYSFFWVGLGCRFLAFIPSIISYQINKPAWIVAGVTLTYLLLLATAIVFNALHTVIFQAMYEYIAHRKTIRYFQTDDLATAISPGF